MKHMKKIASLLLALTLVFALSAGVFADEQKGSITVANPTVGETYTAYKVFDLTYKTTGEGEDAKTIVSYSFTKTDANTAFFNALNGENSPFTVTETTTANVYNVSLKDGKGASDIKTFLDGQVADGNLTTTIAPITAEKDKEVKFENLDLGYYYVKSSLGSLIALDSTEPDATIYEKNSVPTITKEVWEDDGDKWSNTFATFDIIETLKYRLTVNNGNGYLDNGTQLGTGVNDDYTIVDKLDEDFVYNNTAVVVKNGETEWTVDSDYTVTYNGAKTEMTITLNASKLETLEPNTNIFITYEVVVGTNTQVVIGNQGDNRNTATLTYSEQSSSDNVYVNTYEIGGTWENPPFKKVDQDGNALAGVKFILSKDVTTVEGEEATTTTVYAAIDSNDILTGWAETGTEILTKADGTIDVKGLDEGTYILTETATLDGYNLLTDTITVVIDHDGNVTYQYTKDVGQEGKTASSTIEVVNQSGSSLPTTGGMGTTVLYTLGILLVLSAGVLLIVRRRMSAAE